MTLITNSKQHIKAFATMAFALALVCLSSYTFSAKLAVQNQLLLGNKAPDFTLRSSAKENIRLAEQRGKYVVIHFWASFSGASIKQLDQLENLYQEHKIDGLLTVLSISEDPDKSGPALTKVAPQHHVLMDDDQKVSKLFQIKTIPSLFLLDQSGEIVMALDGYDPRYFDLIESKVNRYLEEQ